ANQHLTKPFQSIRTLISTVKGLLESHPPKITAPLTPNAGGTGNLLLAKPIEEKKAEAPEAKAVQLPAAVAAPATEAFPPNSEEQPPLIPTENLLAENLLEAETESDWPEPEPVLETVPEPEPLVAEAEQDKEIEENETPIFADVVQPTESIPAEEIAVSAVETHNGLASDLDHILDLDDVLPEIWPQPSPRQSVAAGFATDLQSAIPSTIPQTVIDEIVNRVVAQLSEKLTQKLAIQLAPEVAEIVKQQTQLGPSTIPTASRRESDPLLELD
ncbi:MAG: hypothetical protein LH647_01265, partial [Leptolyngbyaceae cyanobacterium CAN_BIN12]|nr:hypothetical protein [Leptolyngbyaceae cyanobacterium CAN_BIN12]